MIQKFNKIRINNKENLIKIYSFNFHIYLINILLEKMYFKHLFNQI